MKTLNEITRLATMFAACIIILASCTQNGSKDLAEEQNEEKFSTHEGEKNAQLLVDLVSSNYYEIRLSKYAIEHSTNALVENLASMLVTDHTSLLNDLRSLASQKNISIPNEDSVDVNNKIKAWDDMKTTDLERAWVNEMIDRHHKSINRFNLAIKDEDIDTNIKNTLTGALPTVQSHLDKLQALKDQLK